MRPPGSVGVGAVFVHDSPTVVVTCPVLKVLGASSTDASCALL